MLSKIENVANEMLRKHNLHQSGWQFKWNQTKTSYGKCSGSNKTIYLSRLTTPFRNIEDIKNTIKHEIAHALVGCKHGHNTIWKRKCIEIGAEPERIAKDSVSYQLRPKYIGTCPSCGHKTQSFRKLKRRTSCAKCSPKFNERFLFVWVKSF